MILRINIWLIAFHILMGELYAQQALPKPTVKPYEGVTLEGLMKKPDKKRPWVVYSDRENNQSSLASLGYLERFYVKNINYLEKKIEIVKDPAINGRNFSNAAKNYGWVSTDNMLLWEHCLIDKRTRVDRKAIITYTPEALTEIMADRKRGVPLEFSKEVKLYLNPVQVGTERQIDLYNFFFIYKVVVQRSSTGRILNRRVLLATDYKFDDDVRANATSFLGWVDENKIKQWNTRIALEPNWEKNSWDERQNILNRTRIFRESEIAEDYQYQTGNFVVDRRSLVWDGDPVQDKTQFVKNNRRYPGTVKRFPLLPFSEGLGTGVNYENRGIYHLGVFGEVNTINTGVFKPGEYEVIKDKFDKYRARKKNINIVFVIDGTRSMHRFFPPVSEALKKTINDMNNDSDLRRLGYNPKFGVVIYRDEAEVKECWADTLEVTDNYESVIRFFSKYTTKDKKPSIEYTRCNRKDTDQPEALFYGLNIALEEVGFSEFETNVLVLIGDTGDHSRKGVSKYPRNETIVQFENITNSITNYDCNVLVFQCYGDNLQLSSQSRQTFKEYRDIGEEILNQTIAERYKNVKIVLDKRPQWKIEKYPLPKVHETIKSSDYRGNEGVTEYEYKNTSFANMLIYPDPNVEEVRPSILTDAINDIIIRSATNNHNFYENLSNIVNGYESSSGITYSEPRLYQELWNLDPDSSQIRKLADAKFQFILDGYASKKLENNSSQFDAFNFVLFMTKDDLEDLRDILDKLAHLSGTGSLQKKFADAWKAIFGKYFGDMKTKEILKMSDQEIADRLQVIPTSGKSLLTKFTLKEILNNLDDKEIINYVENSGKKLRKVQQILARYDTYKYAYEPTPGRYYYWIEEELLP